MALMPKSKTVRAIILLGIFALLVALGYAVENWRGEHAWRKYKTELEAKGAVLDWKKLVPPAVPDDQNFFKAPKMAEWFVKPASGIMTNDLTDRISLQNFSRQFSNSTSLTIAELTWLPPDAAAASDPAAVELRCVGAPASFFVWTNNPSTNSFSPDSLISVIHFEDAPLDTCAENLARRAGVGLVFDPKQFPQPFTFPVVSQHWQNVTAMQALQALLHEHQTRLEAGPNSNSVCVVTNPADASPIFISPEARGKLTGLLQDKIGANIVGSQQLVFLSAPTAEIKPLRIVCRSESPPVEKDLARFFSELFPNNAAQFGSPRIHLETNGANAFRIVTDAACATDYLNWNGQFDSDFNLIRAALKRPYTRMDGNYDGGFATTPVPNYVAVRTVAQTLAQRTQCYLLLGQPEKALSEITLFHDLCRVLEGAPTGRPMSLVAVMINVAVTGLYVDTLADGIRLRAWRESELAAVQSQLKDINVFPFMADAIREERAGYCSFLEDKLSHPPGLARMIKNESSLLMPRGWLYQNLVNLARLDQELLDSFDLSQNLISPQKLKTVQQESEIMGEHFRPYSFFVAIAVPNYSRAFQTFAFNQTKANEAQIACALERFHLANGNYPKTLAALAPQFIEKIPHDVINGQPLHYRRTEDGKFLLYSVGWNETDDDGSPGTLTDVNNGDWVWPCPVH